MPITPSSSQSAEHAGGWIAPHAFERLQHARNSRSIMWAIFKSLSRRLAAQHLVAAAVSIYQLVRFRLPGREFLRHARAAPALDVGFSPMRRRRARIVPGKAPLTARQSHCCSASSPLSRSYAAMHGVRPVGKAQRAHMGPHAGEREILD